MDDGSRWLQRLEEGKDAFAVGKDRDDRCEPLGLGAGEGELGAELVKVREEDIGVGDAERGVEVQERTGELLKHGCQRWEADLSQVDGVDRLGGADDTRAGAHVGAHAGAGAGARAGGSAWSADTVVHLDIDVFFLLVAAMYPHEEAGGDDGRHVLRARTRGEAGVHEALNASLRGGLCDGLPPRQAVGSAEPTVPRAGECQRIHHSACGDVEVLLGARLGDQVQELDIVFAHVLEDLDMGGNLFPGAPLAGLAVDVVCYELVSAAGLCVYEDLAPSQLGDESEG